MTTSSFTVKVNKIQNKKEKDYFIYRVNVPVKAAKELDLKNEDYLLIHAKKAEWFDLIDWSKASKGLTELPANLKQKINDNNTVKESEFSPHVQQDEFEEKYQQAMKALQNMKDVFSKQEKPKSIAENFLR